MEADRLAREAQQQADEAQTARAAAESHLRDASKLDPDGRRGTDATRRPS
jgi:hypothetical protein